MHRAPCQFDMLYVVTQLGPLLARDFDTTVRVAGERFSLQLESAWIEGKTWSSLFCIRNHFL